MPTSNRLVFPHSLTSESVTSRTAVYGPVRTVVWQGSVGDRRPYADQVSQRLPITLRGPRFRKAHEGGARWPCNVR
jgi:hypothetical protein